MAKTSPTTGDSVPRGFTAAQIRTMMSGATGHDGGEAAAQQPAIRAYSTGKNVISGAVW